MKRFALPSPAPGNPPIRIHKHQLAIHFAMGKSGPQPRAAPLAPGKDVLIQPKHEDDEENDAGYDQGKMVDGRVDHGLICRVGARVPFSLKKMRRAGDRVATQARSRIRRRSGKPIVIAIQVSNIRRKRPKVALDADKMSPNRR